MLFKPKNSYPLYIQDWISLFNKIKAESLNEKYYEHCINGRLKDSKFSLVTFKNELIELVNYLLTRNLKLFIHDINLLLETDDLNSIMPRINKLEQFYNRLEFYKKLSFLDEKFINELSDSIKENKDKFKNTFLEQEKKEYIDNENLFDFYYQIKKHFK